MKFCRVFIDIAYEVWFEIGREMFDAVGAEHINLVAEVEEGTSGIVANNRPAVDFTCELSDRYLHGETISAQSQPALCCRAIDIDLYRI